VIQLRVLVVALPGFFFVFLFLLSVSVVSL